MAGFEYEYEYSYRISVDEEMMQRYADSDDLWRFKNMTYLFEIRSNFIVKGRSEIMIDSERYAIEGVKDDSDDYLQFFIGLRLKDYWMPDDQIRRLIHELLDFAKQIHSISDVHVRGGMIQAAVDLDVCTVQRQGEETGATVERALRPELLPPLYLYPTADKRRRPDGKFYYERNLYVSHLVGKLKNVRVEDASSAAAVKATVMEVCGVCGRDPVAGGQVSTLLCGHSFHYRCIVRQLLEERYTCPICNHRPEASDEANTGISLKDLEGDIFFHEMICHLGDLTDSDEDLEDYDDDDDSDMEED